MTLRAMLAALFARPLRTIDAIVWQVRAHELQRRFGQVGRAFAFDPITSHYVTPQLLRAGDDCFINVGAHVSGEVVLGDRVLVGPGVKLMSGNHLYGVPGRYPRFLKASRDNPEMLERLVIESDAWIGAGSIVLGGVTIGTGCVLAAGSVASRDLPPFVVAAGAPARARRRIFDDATLLDHLAQLGTEPASAREIVRRRAAAGVAGLPLAQPMLPDRCLYQDVWVACKAGASSDK